MKLNSHTTGINTTKGAESRDFYVRHFGFKVHFDMDGYIHLRHPSSGMEIAFLNPRVESLPPIFQGEFGGAGLWLSLEVDDVDAEYKRLRDALPVELEPRDEPWGERHFVVVDPNGIGVNIMKMVATPKEAAAS